MKQEENGLRKEGLTIPMIVKAARLVVGWTTISITHHPLRKAVYNI